MTLRPTSRATSADRAVDEEDGLPAGPGGERATEQDADGDAEAADRPPQGQGQVALLAVVRRHDERQRGRGQQRCGEALYGAGADQLAGVAGEPADDGGDGEQGQTGQEDLPAGQQVGDAAAEEESAAGHHQVGGDQPLELPPSRCRDRPMVGRAVLTTEMSRTTRIWAVRATARTAQDFLGPAIGWTGVASWGCGWLGRWVWAVHLGGHPGLLPGGGGSWP